MIRARWIVLLLLLACFGLAGAAAPATPTDYPTRPVRFLVGQPTGGGQDIVARAVAQQLTEVVGQSVIVDNRPGASGTLAGAIAAKAPADGYTLLFVASTYAINPGLYPNLPYDPMRDLRPVSLVAATPFILLLHPSVPARSVKELIAFAKEHPRALNYASGGLGNSGHLAGELFALLAQVQLTHIPYKGTGQAMPDLLAGRVQMLFNSAVQAMPYVKGDQLRALAVTTAKRMPTLPELPTIAEAGVPGYEFSSWYGVVAPSRTPNDIVNALSAAIARATQEARFKQRLARDGGEPIGSTPGQFAQHLKAEVARWAAVVKAAGMKVE